MNVGNIVAVPAIKLFVTAVVSVPADVNIVMTLVCPLNVIVSGKVVACSVGIDDFVVATNVGSTVAVPAIKLFVVADVNAPADDSVVNVAMTLVCLLNVTVSGTVVVCSVVVLLVIVFCTRNVVVNKLVLKIWSPVVTGSISDIVDIKVADEGMI